MHTPHIDDDIERVEGVEGVIDVDYLATLRKVSGDNQHGYLNRRLTNPFVVTVRDADDMPVAGVQVIFQVIHGDGILSVTNPWTDSEGQAQSFLTLGSLQGEYRVAASVAGIAGQVTFSATVNIGTIVPGTPLKTLIGHTDVVKSVAYSPDGSTLATGSFDKTVRLWDVVTGKHKGTITGNTKEVYSVAYSPDGRTFATNWNWGEIRLWDAITGQHKQTLQGHTVLVISIAYSPDGGTLATGDLIGEIRLWDAVTGEYKTTLTGQGNVFSIAFSADSRTLASGGYDKRIILLWDAVTGEKIKTLIKDHTRMSFSPDGRTFASVGGLTIWLWDVVTWQPLKTLTGHKASVNTVAFSPDGGTVATGSSDSEIRLWDIATGQLKGILIGHTDVVRSVAFSPDGVTLASASNDGKILIWDMSKYVTPVDNIPNGNLRATALLKISGDKQEGPPSATLANPLVVEVKDQNGNALEGVAVSFVVTAGGGMISTSTDTTDVSGRAQTTLTLGSDAGTNTVSVTVAGIEQPVAFTGEAVAATPDFDGDGAVNIADFLLFVGQFGFSQDDAGYEARFDLDGDGVIGIGDFLIFVNNFGNAGS